MDREKYDINQLDKWRRAALHFACFPNNRMAIVEYFPNRWCRLDPFDDHLSSPVMKAVQSSLPTIVTLLLKNGASPNLADYDGETPLLHFMLTAQILPHNF